MASPDRSTCTAQAASTMQAPERRGPQSRSAPACPLSTPPPGVQPHSSLPSLICLVFGLLTIPLCLKSLQQMEGNLAITSARSFKYTYWPIFTDLIVYKITLCAIPVWIVGALSASDQVPSPRLGHSHSSGVSAPSSANGTEQRK